MMMRNKDNNDDAVVVQEDSQEEIIMNQENEMSGLAPSNSFPVDECSSLQSRRVGMSSSSFSSYHKLSVILLVAHLVLPFASPFALGIDATAGVGAMPNAKRTFSSSFPPLIQQQKQQHSNNKQHQQNVVVASTTTTPTALAMASESNAVTAPSLAMEKIRNCFGGKGTVSKTAKQHKEEQRMSIPSRLLFRYLTPLLDTATKRPLTSQDAFENCEYDKMDRSVASLTRLYRHVQQEHTAKRLRSKKRGAVTAVTSKDAASSLHAWLLAKALFLHQRKMLVTTGIMRFANTLIQAFPAMLVARLLRLVEAGNEHPPSKAVMVAMTLMSILTVKMITENQYFHNVVKMAAQIRGSVAGLVFEKSLRLPGGGSSVARHDDIDDQDDEKKNGDDQEKKTTTSELGAGGVLNLMQSDAAVLEHAAMQVHTIWDGPLQIAIYSGLLFKYLGPSVAWGIGVLLLMIPVNSATLRILDRLSKYEYQAKEARTKRTTESIRHMKLLKLQGWESQFAQDIRTQRVEEMRRHLTRGMVRALSSAVSNTVPALVLVVTLTAYMKSGRPLVASTIFTAISLFNQLRFPLFFYPMLIDSLANARTSLKRISTYLSAEEITPYVQRLPPLELDDGRNRNSQLGGCIEMKHGNFLWSASSSSALVDNSNGESAGSVASPALCDIDAKVGPGEIVAVVGSVGSGKTALVEGLLGELVPVPRMVVQPSSSSSMDASFLNKDNNKDEYLSSMEQPVVITHGEVAYCSQEAWLPKGSIRDAVVFGREYSEERYRQALYDAGLDRDLQNGTLSDETDVGEGGSSLSGGQRARVALARALYGGPETRVYLFDDCLAALDARVGAMVFDRLTRRLKQRNAAAILVTNDPSLPRRCDRVFLMGKTTTTTSTDVTPSTASCSTIIDVGTYDELISRGHSLKSISAHDTEEVEREDEEEKDDNDGEGGIPLQHTDIQMKFVATNNHEGHPFHASNSTVDILSTPLVGKVAVKAGCSTRHRHHVVNGKNTVKKTTIRVVGGYELPSNSTDQASCHADPDCQNRMETSPNYWADHVVPIAPDSAEEVVDEVSEHHEQNIQQQDEGLLPPPPPPPPPPPAKVAISLPKKPTMEPKQPSTTFPVQTQAATAPKKGTDTAKLKSADDTMTGGAVPWSTYLTYLKSVKSNTMIVAMLFSYLLVNGAQFFQQLTIARWTEAGRGGAEALTAAMSSSYLRSLVHAAGVVSVFMWVRNYLSLMVGIRASRFLHNRMLSSVFSAPMSFFDATPSGQLFSRFGKEMETVDRALPESVGSVLFCFLNIFTAVGALAGVITPVMLIPLAGVSYMYWSTMKRFRPGARDFKRAETKTRSPIYTHFGEALRGTEIIRSIRGASMSWSNRHKKLMDTNLSVFYTLKSLDRWLACRLETLGNVVVFTTAIASIFMTRIGRLNSGNAGWGLTQSLAITGLMTWAVRTLTDLETHMMSVLRIKEMTDLDAEPQIVSKESTSSKKMSRMAKELMNPSDALEPLFASSGSNINATLAPENATALVQDGWPWRGNIQFNNVSMRYNDQSPLVLKGVSVAVPPGTTLGVVGRTGSGKSSLLLTLFRIVDVAGGSIEIDGVDIRSIPLKTLRESLSIIPQDPVLFAGSVYSNMDATGKASPQDVWDALEAASPELARDFRNAQGLNTHIAEGGKNLSLGQRQLICLARALLRKSKILVLDEATSSVDSKTDEQVQNTIRLEFVQKGVTVITVAHRLDTVLGNDKIAVLGSGNLLEYGSPRDLLQNSNGELRRLVDADRKSKQKGAASSTTSKANVSQETLVVA